MATIVINRLPADDITIQNGTEEMKTYMDAKDIITRLRAGDAEGIRLDEAIYALMHRIDELEDFVNDCILTGQFDKEEKDGTAD